MQFSISALDRQVICSRCKRSVLGHIGGMPWYVCADKFYCKLAEYDEETMQQLISAKAVVDDLSSDDVCEKANGDSNEHLNTPPKPRTNVNRKENKP